MRSRAISLYRELLRLAERLPPKHFEKIRTEAREKYRLFGERSKGSVEYASWCLRRGEEGIRSLRALLDADEVYRFRRD